MGDKYEEEEDELEDTEEVAQGSGHQYRYVCPACTGVAYYAEKVYTEHPVGSCRNCGKSMGLLDEGNFIPLTEEQKQSLKDLGV